jgi:chitinase
MNNTLRARSNIELLESRMLFSTISVGPTEAVAGIAPTQAIFTATLNAPSPTPIKLSYSTVNGTAKAGLDYRKTTSHIVIPVGATSATFAVDVLPSTATEANKVFYVKINAGAGNVVTSEIDATIIENGTLPTVTVSDATIKIGLHHVQTSSFFVGLTNRSASPVTVNYTTQNVTAIGGVNYYPVSGSLVFAPFKTEQKIRIKIVGDAIVSPEKVFDVDVTSATNATVPAGLYSRVVVEDDVPGIVPPTLTVSTPEAVRGNDMNFVATLSAPTTGAVSVRYYTEPVTATATQFTSESGILTIPAGQTTGTITVPTALNTDVNVDTTLRLVLSAPANAQVVQSNITGTILAYPTIVVSDANEDETDASPVRPLTFYVTLNAPSPIPVSITYNTVNGDLNANDQDESAAAGVEYTDTSGTLTFAPGQTSLPISVPVLLDASAGSPLFLSVNLSGAVNGIVGRGTGLGTINNLDLAVGVPTLSVSGGSIDVQYTTDAVVNFTVALSNASTLPVTVAYTTQNGTATAGIDYFQASGTLTFNPGQTSLNVPVTVVGASATTVTKTVSLVLSDPVNATIPTLDTTGTGTVTQVGT